MRKAIVLALGVSLLVGAVVGPASAKYGRKRATPRVSFEAAGSISVADHDGRIFGPWILGESGVTESDFLAGCEIPPSQGIDAFVVELSKEVSKVPADVGLEWLDPSRYYDLRMVFYNADCISTGSAGFSEEVDAGHEEGAFAAGTKYVLVSATVGALVDFTLTAIEIR